MSRNIFYSILLICLFAAPSCLAQELSQHKAADDYLNVYQKYLSGLKNTRCSMYPSCSNYAKMVFQDYSFPIAMVMTADRLTRCGHDLSFYPSTYKYGFTSAVDYPFNRAIPGDILVDQTKNPVFVSNTISKDSTKLPLHFITFLINRKNYQGALNEIDKFLFKAEVHLPIEIYSYRLKCFEGLNRYQDGIMDFEQSFPNEAKSSYLSLLNVAHLYDLIGDVDSSLKFFQDASLVYPHDSQAAHPFGEIGKLYVKRKEYNEARLAFQNKYTIDNDIVAFNSSLDIIKNLEAFQGKNRNIAMILSIFPGGGYFYTKQPKNALTAIILNGVLGYASYTSFKSKNYGVGAILGVLGVSFYIGNIVGSGKSAQRYNESIEREYLRKLQSINPFIN